MSRVIGVPKEIKDQESRVSMQPDGVDELVHHGHEVVIEKGAGAGAGFTDKEYDRYSWILLGVAFYLYKRRDLGMMRKQELDYLILGETSEDEQEREPVR